MSDFSRSVQTALDLLQQGDPALWHTVALSLKVSGAATVVGGLLGLVLGCALAIKRWPLHGTIIAVLNTLLALPSVVVGLVVYLLLSRSGPLGSMGLLFTPTAMVVAQSLLVCPIVAALTRQTLTLTLREAHEPLRSMGAGPWAQALLLVLHERRALSVVVLAAFGRAISEVGAVMMVGGNIDGVTRVMTTTIALETSKGDLPLALALGMVLLLIVAGIHAFLAMVRPGQDPIASPHWRQVA